MSTSSHFSLISFTSEVPKLSYLSEFCGKSLKYKFLGSILKELDLIGGEMRGGGREGIFSKILLTTSMAANELLENILIFVKTYAALS